MRRELLSAIRSEGGMLPSELLSRLLAEDKEVPGLSSESYHLAKHEKINEAVSRSWSRLLGAWIAFREQLENFDEQNPGTSETRDRWLYLVFHELGYGRLVKASGLRIEDKDYPISHLWGKSPVHLMGAGVPLDRRSKGIVGAATTSPHSLVQEFLNRSEENLWGLVSNGLILRLLRDNVSLTRQAYVEFDLQSIFDGEAYTDFKLFWLVCHQSRLEFEERPDQCWLEKWSKEAQKLGTRALDSLREGVKRSIESLGRGFLAHPANTKLREDLRSGELDKQDYYRQLLRLVYRLLFLFVAEDRGLLLDPTASPENRQRYMEYYSTGRLRDLAERRKGGRHSDLFQGLKVVMECLGRDEGCPALGLYPLGSFLWSLEALSHLAACHINNSHFLEAVRNLAFVKEKALRRRVDYKNLGPEELGSIYESLLEQHPQLHLEAAKFDLDTAAGNERKSTGSYYTPPELVQCLLDTALEPVVKDRLDEARKQARAAGSSVQDAQERALLNLSVCDPACGSGHFLIAATHRLAHRLATVRSGDNEPAPEEMRRALRDVIRHCIYGVDLNPMAVELCKVSLWMEALEPTKPFPFLDSKILCGNSLLGTTPYLLGKGIPDEAFQALEGDDKKWVAQLKKRNQSERFGATQGQLFDAVEESPRFGQVSQELLEIDDSSLPGLREISDRYRRFRNDPLLLKKKIAADAWCAAFVVRKSPEIPAITQEVFRALNEGENVLNATLKLIKSIAEKYGFLHWHLEFPAIFGLPQKMIAGGSGFDIVLGNPPWEHAELKEKEWFASRKPDIATAPTGAERKRLINLLKTEDPSEFSAFSEQLRQNDATSHFVTNSGHYPLCASGRTNYYAIFAECIRMLLNKLGRFGCVLPTGIATDETTKFFFRDLVESRSLASLFDFENKGIFPGVHGSQKFCLFTGGSGAIPTAMEGEFAFFARTLEDLKDPKRRFRLSATDIALLNPNTRTCPIFRSSAAANLAKEVYSRVPVLINEGPPAVNPWNIRIRRIFNMGLEDVSQQARTLSELMMIGGKRQNPRSVALETGIDYVPMLEGKMFDAFNHRAASVRFNSENRQRGAQAVETTLDELQDPLYSPEALYWYPSTKLATSHTGYSRGRWFLGFKDVSSATNERTMIAAVLPFTASNFSVRIIQFIGTPSIQMVTALLAVVNSFVYDYFLRQFMGGLHVSDYITMQCPVPHPQVFLSRCPWSSSEETIGDWLFLRVLELTYTAWDLQPFATDCGWHGSPFKWNEERRFILRCEIDAALFHLYLNKLDGPADCRYQDGPPRQSVEAIMEQFPTVRRRDEERFGGVYRTKSTILDIYDLISEARRSHEPYQAKTDPGPADSSQCHADLN